jgi:hypothetical protein
MNSHPTTLLVERTHLFLEALPPLHFIALTDLILILTDPGLITQLPLNNPLTKKKNLLNPKETLSTDRTSLKKAKEQILKKNTLNRIKHLLALDKPMLEEGLALLNNSMLFSAIKNFLLNS